MRVLRSYDERTDSVLLEDLSERQEFLLGKRTFKKGEKLRKRYRCEEVDSGKIYLVSAIAEVIPATV
jgi:SprT protein